MLYPPAFKGLTKWSEANGISVSEARRRFAQYVVLRAVASSRALSESLVFKGGNALDFMWQPNRSTLDLDFSTTRIVTDIDSETIELQRLFAAALVLSNSTFGVFCHVASIKRQPPGPEKTFVTYFLRIAYALPDQESLRSRMSVDPKYTPQSVDIDISINEPICADEQIDIAGANPLRVSTPEDIVAEKLRALLQQQIRNRHRPQDMLDIAVILRLGPELDHLKVAAFLLRKAAARNVPVSRAVFRTSEILERARQGYAELAKTTRTLFIPFEEACDQVHLFVDTLDIPA